ncbi:hypothetical protein [Thauera aromatica]|uniref:Uncharacterized protein n=1 Tax=Thauera aromatica K172 TaxID=44139 RepID=A0A2R4BNV6_THAAR|nr:hypothetical protein [Thauera aromatica]AVR89008.1 hypothetical protein Tharo_2105 [Thauera aromatica K172]
MCNYWQSWALAPSWWAQQVAFGWVTGWLQGSARNASWRWQPATPRAGSALLKMQIAQLRLNAAAPFPQQKRAATLRLLRKE